MNGLATAAPFDLGGLRISPATRQVATPDGRARTAEPRVLQVLVALAEADGAVVSRDRLVECCWDGRVVGEDAINRAIAKARRLAALTDPPAFEIETIPRVGYRLRAADGGDPVAALPGSGGPGFGLGRRGLLISGGAAAAAAAAVVGVVGYRALRPITPKPLPLVAVLAFDNLSPDPQLGYFADGLSEDILNALIRGGGVRVTALTSSFSFRGAAKAKAGAALKADYLLDGSVLREGARMRVRVHLEDVAGGQTLWSESYDRDVGPGMDFEDSVAARVSSALKVRFAPRSAAVQPTFDRLAYDLYLQGREATRDHTVESLKRGNALLLAAVARAPNFAAAWFELAKNYWRNGFLESLSEQSRGYELGRQAARRALALDPSNGAAYGVIAEMTPRFGNWSEIDAGMARGAALSPNDPNLMLWRGDFLSQTGRFKAAAAIVRRAQALDPLELYANHKLCILLTYLGAFREAEAMAARIAAIWPDQIAAYWDRFWLLFAWERHAEALAMISGDGVRHREEPEEHAAYRGALRAIIGGSAAARREAGRAVLGLVRGGTGYAENSMAVLARLGLMDETVDLARSLYLGKGSIALDRTRQFRSNSRFQQNGEADTDHLFHPLLAPLRRAGRFAEVFEGVGLAAYWRQAGGPDL